MDFSNANNIQEIESVIDKWVVSAYNGTYHFFILSCVTFAVCSVCFCVLAALLSKKSSFIHNGTSELNLHYLFLTGIVVSAVLNGFLYNQRIHSAIIVTGYFLSLLAVIGLLRFKVYGLVSALIYLWWFVLTSQVNMLMMTNADRLNIDNFMSFGKISVYAVGEYAVFQFAASGFILLPLSVFVVIYYTRRRFLFESFRGNYFNGLPMCPQCKMPALNGSSFCKNCGTEIESPREISIGIKVLDIRKYCADCGEKLIKNKTCINCAVEKSKGKIKSTTFIKDMKKRISAGINEGFITLLKGIVLVAVLIVGVFLPNAVGTISETINDGRGELQSAYVSLVDEFLENPELARDTAWLNLFNSASNALYAFNKRIFYVKFNMLRLSDIVFYAYHLEAVYRQMTVIEDIEVAVNRSETSQVNNLSAEFNESVDNMLEAAFQVRNSYYNGRNGIDTVVASFVAGIRFFLTQSHFRILFYILLAAGFISLVYSLLKDNKMQAGIFERFIERFNVKANRTLMEKPAQYSVSPEPAGPFIHALRLLKSGIGAHIFRAALEFLLALLLVAGSVWSVFSIFSPSSFRKLIKRFLPKKSLVKSVPAHEYKLKQKKERRESLLYVAVSLVLVTLIGAYASSKASPDIMDAAGDLLIENPRNIASFLTMTQTDPDKAYDNYTKNVLSRIDYQLDIIQELKSFKEAPPEHVDFYDGLISFCGAEEKLLQDLREKVLSAKVLNADVLNYTSNIDGYAWLVDEYTEYLNEQIYDVIPDVIG